MALAIMLAVLAGIIAVGLPFLLLGLLLEAMGFGQFGAALDTLSIAGMVAAVPYFIGRIVSRFLGDLKAADASGI
ncbi:hypothetical protein [Sphingomonas japonica]|uniref:Uncharacterized protein n=1 Tax=Sphingomonas japonica TaxID=511662 RepID=A0ABX0U2H2_9SPHN|nr:hypothetical protein [Sphingomonas japonica]NIJ23914.1 hypothetical protein [Sphingomonas japonica]